MNEENFDHQLGVLLREEVPPPGPSFWDEVDARLQSVSVETPDGASSRPDFDLTELSPGSPDPTRPNRLMLVAAAAALIAIGLAGFFALGGSDRSELDVTDDNGIGEVTNDDAEEEDETDGAAIEQTPWRQVGDDIEAGAFGSFVGDELAISGDGNTVAVRTITADSRDASDPDDFTRTAWVLRWNGTTWEQLGDPFVSGHIGFLATPVALSSDGNTLVLGEPFGLSPVARILRWDGSAWIELGAGIPFAFNDDALGQTVAVSADGNTVALGDPAASTISDRIGRVRVYRWDGENWSTLGEGAFDESADSLGNAIDISGDGNRLVAGGFDIDRAFVFEWNGTDWEQIGSALTPDTDANLFFGEAVAISGDGETVAVGGPLANGDELPIASVFRLIDGTWVEVGQRIEGDDSSNLFAISLDLSTDGNTVVVGEPGGGPDDPGRSHVFTWTGETWQEVGPPISFDDSDIGKVVSISADGSTVALGGNVSPDGGPDTNADSGRVRVLRIENDG